MNCQDKVCKKSCRHVEYKTLETRDYKSIHHEGYDKNTFGFMYQFVFPQATRNLRTTKPFKTVRKEYLVMDQNSLIGKVGGILGMFVGFSFLALAEWLITLTGNIWEWIKKKKWV